MAISPEPRPLPERPDLAQLKRQAKERLRARRSSEPALRLADVQLELAREHGFASWPRLSAAIGGPRRRATRPPRAVDQPTTFGPSVFIAGAVEAGWEPGTRPTALVFVFQHVVADRLATDDRFVEEPSMAVGNGRYFRTVDEPTIAVSCTSPGAAAMVGQVENQVALGGASTFVVLNLAGGLGTETVPGELAVVEAAVRDDGISDHYLASADTVDADPDLAALLLAACRTVTPGAHGHVSWTNPATFRQTRAQVDHCVAEGVTLVESEAASLLAVCEAVGVTGGAVLLPAATAVDGRQERPVPFAELAEVLWRALEAIVGALRTT